MSCSEWWGIKSYALQLRCHHTASGMYAHVSEQEFGFTPPASHRTLCSHNEILLRISPLSQEKLAVIPRKLNLHPVLWGKISFMCEGMGQNPQFKHRECFWVENCDWIESCTPGHAARGSRNNKKGENKGRHQFAFQGSVIWQGHMHATV